MRKIKFDPSTPYPQLWLGFAMGLFTGGFIVTSILAACGVLK